MPRSAIILVAATILLAAAPPPGFGQFWTAESGEGRLALHTDLVRTLGIRAPSAAKVGGRLTIPFRLEGRLELLAPGSLFRDLAGGEIRLDSSAELHVGGTRVPLRGLAVRRGPEERTVTIVGADGRALFDGDAMHFTVDRRAGRVRLFNIDLRLTAESAALLGEARYAGVAVGVLELVLDAAIPAEVPSPNGACTTPSWGMPHNDVALISVNSIQQMAREGVFPSGRIAVAPSAVLKNVGTTDVPWYEKFSGTFPPYANDQHPLLVWNMYRIAGNAIEQIGVSPLKHAFLTLNTSCGCAAGNILWPTCEDTYGSGTNDSIQDLGPRAEITAHTGVWQRCGSIFDTNCDGVQNPAPPRASPMDRRMAVRESDLQTAGAAYYVDSWYIVRDDVDIFNSMGFRRVTPTGGTTWTFALAGSYTPGPVIDQWVDPDAPGPNAQSVRVDTGKGRVKLAVRAQDLGGGLWRYEYALMNFDFDSRVRMFSIPLPRGAVVTDVGFHDVDGDAATDWTAVASKRLTWTAPTAGAAQDYATLFNFRFTVNAPPTAVDGSSVNVGVLEDPALPVRPTILGPGAVPPRAYSK